MPWTTRLKPLLNYSRLCKGFEKQLDCHKLQSQKKLGITQQSYAAFELSPQLASAERLIKILRLLNVEISLSHSADPQLAGKANSKITKSIKQAKKPSKQRPELTSLKTSRAALEKVKKESW